MPFVRTGCIVIVADGTIKLTSVLTASGTPIECPPPSTIETDGFDIPAIISAIASPASTSPPTVFSTTISPSTVLSCSIAASAGIRCSYFVVLVWGGRRKCPSICPIIDRQCMLCGALTVAIIPLSIICWFCSSVNGASFLFSSHMLNFPPETFFVYIISVTREIMQIYHINNSH